jgi:predicted enzyme related to lactoylglutathione lyase
MRLPLALTLLLAACAPAAAPAPTNDASAIARKYAADAKLDVEQAATDGNVVLLAGKSNGKPAAWRAVVKDGRVEKWEAFGDVRPVTAAPTTGGRATGIGGIFFKAEDPKKLTAWYVEQLGLPAPKFGVMFPWREEDGGPASTTWGAFKKDTKYFDPTVATFMINYRVKNLDEILARLRKAGARVDDKIEEEDNGRFGWAVDPEGNRFELWEPKPGH